MYGVFIIFLGRVLAPGFLNSAQLGATQHCVPQEGLEPSRFPTWF